MERRTKKRWEGSTNFRRDLQKEALFGKIETGGIKQWTYNRKRKRVRIKLEGAIVASDFRIFRATTTPTASENRRCIKLGNHSEILRRLFLFFYFFYRTLGFYSNCEITSLSKRPGNLKNPFLNIHFSQTISMLMQP